MRHSSLRHRRIGGDGRTRTPRPMWELLCAGFRHSAGLHATMFLDGATNRPRERGDVRDVPSVLVVWSDRWVKKICVVLAMNKLYCTNVCCEWVSCLHHPSIFWNSFQETEINTISQIMYTISSNSSAFVKLTTAKLKMKTLPTGFSCGSRSTSQSKFSPFSNCCWSSRCRCWCSGRIGLRDGCVSDKWALCILRHCFHATANSGRCVWRSATAQLSWLSSRVFQKRCDRKTWLVTILALDLGDSVMLDMYGLTSSCRHVGSRKQCKSDQPALTLVWVSSHFERDSSSLHRSGASLTVPRKVLRLHCTSAGPTGSASTSIVATASPTGPGTPGASSWSRLLGAAFYYGYSRHGEDPHLWRQ